MINGQQTREKMKWPHVPIHHLLLILYDLIGAHRTSIFAHPILSIIYAYNMFNAYICIFIEWGERERFKLLHLHRFNGRNIHNGI